VAELAVERLGARWWGRERENILVPLGPEGGKYQNGMCGSWCKGREREIFLSRSMLGGNAEGGREGGKKLQRFPGLSVFPTKRDVVVGNKIFPYD
jgi:hypothetical protein